MELYHPCFSHFNREKANFISLWREEEGGEEVWTRAQARAEHPNIGQYYYCVGFFFWGCLSLEWMNAVEFESL